MGLLILGGQTEDLHFHVALALAAEWRPGYGSPPVKRGKAVHGSSLRSVPTECNRKASPTTLTSDGDDGSMKLDGFWHRPISIGPFTEFNNIGNRGLPFPHADDLPSTEKEDIRI